MKIQIVKKGSKVKTAGSVCPWLVDIGSDVPKQ